MDDLSSAHVYLRMKSGMSMDDISEELILECSSLVKSNSIAGCKVSIFKEFTRQDNVTMQTINLNYFDAFPRSLHRKVRSMSCTLVGRI